jgi:hypothetical protein
MATEIQYINPADLTSQDYSNKDLNLINQNNISSNFNPSLNYIEYTIYNNGIPTTTYNYNRYSIANSGLQNDGSIYSIDIDIEGDLLSRGFRQGSYKVLYTFLNNELTTSPSGPFFYVKNISSDRTEITIATTNLTNDELETAYNTFRAKLDSTDYFQDFYLNFGNNRLYIANNIALNNTTNQYELLINLYEPLPFDVLLLDTFWIVTQVANSIAADVSFPPTVTKIRDNINVLRGPNTNLSIKDQVNNTTDYIDYDRLVLSSSISPQYSQIQNILNEKSLNINVDYTDFSNFIHFSSAVSRVNNFYYKASLIENASSSLNAINNLNSFDSSGSKAYYTNLINNTIKNFDGYEYYLYYDSGSWAWPKSTTTRPYTLRSTGSNQVQTWLTNILSSASYYDENNQDYVYYTLPEYLKDDERNTQYFIFLDLIGQYYDNIWVYYKDLNNRYNADNRLDYGISKDLIAEALKSFGIKLYQNNFSTDDLYSAFLGYTSGSTTISNSLPISSNSGIEYITNYISASYTARVTPLDDVNKETYKRLYHNLPYLLKTKGTIPGLRALINCFGIPDTILRISEFGGRDKDTSTYDYFDNKYNTTAYIQPPRAVITSSLRLDNNFEGTLTNNAPRAIQFRFKPDNFLKPGWSYSQSLMLFSAPTSSPISSSALAFKYEGTGLTSGSYNGSIPDPLYQIGKITFIPFLNITNNKTELELPIFNGEWWSVMLTIDEDGTDNIFTLYAGSKGYYNGYDGNQIWRIASGSVTVPKTDNRWVELRKLTIGDGSSFTSHSTYIGYIQELRIWSKPPGVEAFKDFIMNPSSIDYDGEENNYADYLAFRAPLGNELYTGSKSIHPKITGSWIITQSFEDGTSNLYTESINYANNIESFFYDQPIAGIKNRVTDKIQIVSSSYPTGSTLSQYRSLDQTYPTLGSETPDINLLEVAFSPQNEINNDIIASLGYFNIGEYIGDPRQVSSSATTYPDLVNLSNDFFQKYFASYDLFDYIRLIKYFDNSLFKMIQDFVPARTSLTSGVVIKQHLLERNKYPQPQVEWEDVTYSGSLTTAFIDGGTGGTFDPYNFTGSTFPPTFINNTQSWGEEVKTPAGLLTISRSSQEEFYNGELPGTEFVVEDGELNPNNLYKYPNRDGSILDWGLTFTASSIIPKTNTSVRATRFADFSNFNPNPSDNYTYTGLTLGVNSITITPLQITASISIIYNTASTTTPSQIPSSVFLSSTFLFTRKTSIAEGLADNVPGKKLYYQSLISSSTLLTYPQTVTITTSGSFLPSPNETYDILFRRDTNPALVFFDLTGSFNIKINQTLPPGNSPLSSSQLANYALFEYGDYNAIIDNVEDAEMSQYFLDIDYSQNPVIPVNQIALIDNNAVFAPVQDSNYNSYAWSNIRYNGVKYNSIKINT